MRLPRNSNGEGLRLNMTPFIDMMFILVVFFVATSRFQEAERDERIRLARSASKLPIATLSETLVINIDREGRWIVEGRERTVEELERIVREYRAERKDAEVVVRADVRGRIGPLAQAFEICHRLGLKAPNFAYENASGEGSR